MGGKANVGHQREGWVAGRAGRPDNGLTGGKATVDAATLTPTCPRCGARRREPTIWGGTPGCQHDFRLRRQYVESGGGAGSSSEAWSAPGEANAERIRRARWREYAVCATCGAWRGQLGLEPEPAMYVEHLVEVFREVRRVLRDDGLLFLNIGDSYANDAKWGGGTTGKHSLTMHGPTGIGRGRKHTGLPPKSLMQIPARLSIALQEDGWVLRNDIVWFKKAPMPESVTDRFTTSWEHIYMLAKQPKYFFDQTAVRERDVAGNGFVRGPRLSYQNQDGSPRGSEKAWDGVGGGRNRRDVWTLGPDPYPDGHFAVFPKRLPEIAILAGTSPKACGTCGAPWRRRVERSGQPPEPEHRQPPKRLAPGQAGNVGKGNMGFRASRLSGQEMMRWRLENPDVTTGWEPTCAHDDPTGRCRVLDPFAGSGTVGVVCEWHRRDFVGLELNPEYAEMARRRIEVEGRLGRSAYRPEPEPDAQMTLEGLA
jgi:DNA modification methylase